VYALVAYARGGDVLGDARGEREFVEQHALDCPPYPPPG
jgi:hypothetical protein